MTGKLAAKRLAARQEQGVALAGAPESWLRTEHARLSPHAPVAKAMDYMPTRWDGFTRFLHDGRVFPTNNAAERALRGVALGRRAWLFRGSDRDGQRAAAMYSLIVSAKTNDVDPQAWLADVPVRINDLPRTSSLALLPWEWKRPRQTTVALRWAMIRTRPLFTLERVAEFLGEGVDWLMDIAIELEPEVGCLTVFGPGEQWFHALTDDGIENLKDLIHTSASLTGWVLSAIRIQRVRSPPTRRQRPPPPPTPAASRAVGGAASRGAPGPPFLGWPRRSWSRPTAVADTESYPPSLRRWTRFPMFRSDPWLLFLSTTASRQERTPEPVVLPLADLRTSITSTKRAKRSLSLDSPAR